MAFSLGQEYRLPFVLHGQVYRFADTLHQIAHEGSGDRYEIACSEKRIANDESLDTHGPRVLACFEMHESLLL